MFLRKQNGYTLLELIFVIGITGMMTLAIMSFVVNTSRGYQYLDHQSRAAVDLSNTLNRVSKVIRGTTDVVDAQSNSLTIYGYFSPNDAVVKKIRYFKSGNKLMVGVIPPSGSGPNYTYNQSNEEVSVLQDYLSMGSSSIFSYYDASGAQLTGAFSTTQIKQIGLNMAINPKPTILEKPISSQTIVTLRNKKVNL